MRSTIFAVALAAGMPAVLCAQRGGGSRSPASAPAPTAAPAAAPRTPSSRDLADLNPAALLVSKHKKASLTDSTVARLKDVQKMIAARNAQFYATYDSVRRWTLPMNADNASTQGLGLRGGTTDPTLTAPVTSPAEQAKMQSSLRDLRVLMAGYRERRRSDVADAMAVIPEARRQAAADLLGQQDKELEQLLETRP